MKAALILAALLAAAPALSQPAVADSLLDELLSSLPHQEEWGTEAKANPAEIARIGALNPGREQDVTPILAAHARCIAGVVAATTRRTLRIAGRGLGAEKVRELIAFYRSDEARRLDAIEALAQKGEASTPAQEEEMRRIMAAHPVLTEFATAIQGSGRIVGEDKFFLPAAERCNEARAGAFAKAALRFD
ncbi:MAG: hypothetical protein JO013_01475 [Alphaproteobacteria bacterium]|nr:hypothetical protein [Alphaproteobacteria bacterium]